MKALRIFLTQASANYRKEESMLNKMTYPLPPVSTVIGALHAACGYTEYHKMDISIQGKYGAMTKEPYTDYCFLNSTMDDRGILVKMKNENLYSKADDKVASAKKSQGNSFRKEETIQVHNRELLTEYQQLKELGDEIKAFKTGKFAKVQNMIKSRKTHLAAKKKLCIKGSEKWARVDAREKEIKALEKKFKDEVKKYEFEHYTKQVSCFKSLTTSVKYYEVLHEVELLLHIRADDKVLNDILEHIYELKSIGRSEDFVDVKEAKIVELTKDLDDEDICNPYAAYVDVNDVEKKRILCSKRKEGGGKTIGTKYYLNKDYDVELAREGVRQFNRVKVVYMSEHYFGKSADNVFLDRVGDKIYIVNFL